MCMCSAERVSKHSARATVCGQSTPRQEMKRKQGSEEHVPLTYATLTLTETNELLADLKRSCSSIIRWRLFLFDVKRTVSGVRGHVMFGILHQERIGWGDTEPGSPFPLLQGSTNATLHAPKERT